MTSFFFFIALLAYLGEIENEYNCDYYLLIDLVFIFYLSEGNNTVNVSSVLYTYFSSHVWSSEVYRTSSLKGWGDGGKKHYEYRYKERNI